MSGSSQYPYPNGFVQVEGDTCSSTPPTLTGVPPQTLQQWLYNAQTAYSNLMTGAQPQTVTYGSGDGNRSVTYNRTNIAALTAFIGQLNQALGNVRRARRAIGVSFP